MPGYAIIETLKLIRSPVKKTRLWAQRKASEIIKRLREHRGKAGLGATDAWIWFGEAIIKHDLIPVFDESLRGLVTSMDLQVPHSELAIHQRAAGYPIQAFAIDKNSSIAYAVYRPPDRLFGYIAGSMHEVISPALLAAVEKKFGPQHSMKSESMRGIHGGEFSRGVVGETGATTKAARDKWEAFERSIKEKLPWEKRQVGLVELSDADLGPFFDHIMHHINEYDDIRKVPKPLLILAKRYVRAHMEMLRALPLMRIHEQYGPIMGQIIEQEMGRGFAAGGDPRALVPKPVGVYRDLLARRREREELAGRDSREASRNPQWGGFLRESAYNKIVERFMTAKKENWSREVEAAFATDEVREASGDYVYLTDGTAFDIRDLNRRELENSIDGLNIPLAAR